MRSNSLVCNPNWLPRHVTLPVTRNTFCLLSRTRPGLSIFKLPPYPHPRVSFGVSRSRKRGRATGKTNGEPPKKEFSAGQCVQELGNILRHFNFSWSRGNQGKMSASRLVNYFCKRCNCNSRRGVGFWTRSLKIYARERINLVAGINVSF